LRNRSLVLLSGENTTIPSAEARSLFLTYDPDSSFESPMRSVLLARSEADPFRVGRRIAFARRVGVLLDDLSEAAPLLGGRRVRFRCFDLGSGRGQPDPAKYLEGVDAVVDLRNPDCELTLVRCDEDYIAVTDPGSMLQGWSKRRPRSRPFFHPSAIFPKLSRALLNLSRCKEGDVFLDPFAGTGSIPIEASIIGARVVAVDQSELMVRGAISNMRHFSQDWHGVIRADSANLPLTSVDAVATDIPYGRASSTRGYRPEELLELIFPSLLRITRPGSTLVLMHPQDTRVQGPAGFTVEEEHHLYVHKLLTRTITILRRN
jgi:tRNA (guanine10-N2)-dimethyltransferase